MTIKERYKVECEIETLRLCMRRPINEDISVLEKLWKDEKVREFLGGVITNGEIEHKITDLQNHWDLYRFGQCVVVEKNSNQIIGLCGLHHSADGVEVSYMFFPHFWGRGFAQEAVLASINYGFNMLQMESILAITQALNTKSCLLLNAVGMKCMSNFMRFNAMQSLYKITKNEWQRSR